MTRALCLVCLVLGLSAPAFAQTTQTLLWDYPGISPATVALYQQAVSIDGVPVIGSPSCTGSATLTICTLSIPSASGPRVFSVTATLNGVQKTTTRTIDPSTGPAQPGTPRITITVTVTL